VSIRPPRRDGSTSLALLAVSLALVAVLFSVVACIYVATYLEGSSELAAALNRIADHLESK
jgi:hypothetical protein